MSGLFSLLFFILYFLFCSFFSLFDEKKGWSLRTVSASAQWQFDNLCVQLNYGLALPLRPPIGPRTHGCWLWPSQGGSFSTPALVWPAVLHSSSLSLSLSPPICCVCIFSFSSRLFLSCCQDKKKIETSVLKNVKRNNWNKDCVNLVSPWLCRYAVFLLFF